MASVTDHLSRLIAIPSRSDLTNLGVIDYAASFFRSAGWQTERIAYDDGSGVQKLNLIAAPADALLSATEVDLAFFCHTDTVPPRQGWAEALTARTQDEHVHGCGACDVKGFLACLLTAAGSGTAVHPGIRIVLTADEEIGCVGTKHLLSLKRLRPRRVVVGEPTSLKIAHAGKGYCLAELIVNGREAHSALPANGASAIFAAASLITKIEAIAKQAELRTNHIYSPPFTTLNVGLARGGTAKNIVAAACSFIVEWRPVSGDEDGRVLQEIEAAAQRVQSERPGISVSVNVQRRQAGFETDADTHLVRTMQALAGSGLTSIAFGSEASLLAPLVDEVVVFGPGDMNSAHSDRERVAVSELVKAVSVLEALMTEEQAG